LEGVVEVCVSDNGSSDGTRELVQQRRADRPAVVVYDRFEENQGFAANLLRVIELAHGEFCWIFGSDDVVLPGGVQRVLALLERHPDVTGATLYPTLYDFAGQRELRSYWPQPLPAHRDREQRWTRLDDAAVQCGLVMGVLPAQIVRRDLWLEVVQEPGASTFLCSGHFPHLAVIYRMLRRRPVWSWEPARVFHLRADNSNSVVEGFGGNLIRYHLETTAETVAIWREIFGRGPIVRGLLRRCLQAVFNPIEVSAYRLHPVHEHGDDRRLLFAAVGWFWRFPEFWLLTVPVLLVPRALLRRVQAAVVTRRRRRAARDSAATCPPSPPAAPAAPSP